MGRKGYCKIAEGDCRAPAGVKLDYAGGGFGKCERASVGTCARCGEDVCTSPDCSEVRTYRGQRRRLCLYCLDAVGAWNAL